jgi:hypothetical protein
MQSDRAQLCIGQPSQLSLSHACPSATHLYPEDGLEWHRFSLVFENGVFRANLKLDTWLSSFLSFRDELIALNKSLKGKATLSTTECDLRLEAAVDKLGHITWNGRLRYPGPEPVSALDFSLNDDQTSINALIAQVETVIAEARSEPDPPIQSSG